MAKEKVCAVFGLGSFGMELCAVLVEKGARVIAFDNDARLIDRVKDTVAQALLIDSTNEDAMAEGPLADVDMAVVAMGENIEASVLTTALLKKTGVPFILARALTDIHARVLKQIGADEVVNLEIDEGRRVADMLMSREVLDSIPVSVDFSIVEIYTPQKYIGDSVGVLQTRQKVRVIALKRPDMTVDNLGNPVRNERVIRPSELTELRDNDILILFGRNTDIDDLKAVK